MAEPKHFRLILTKYFPLGGKLNSTHHAGPVQWDRACPRAQWLVALYVCIYIYCVYIYSREGAHTHPPGCLSISFHLASDPASAVSLLSWAVSLSSLSLGPISKLILWSIKHRTTLSHQILYRKRRKKMSLYKKNGDRNINKL